MRKSILFITLVLLLLSTVEPYAVLMGKRIVFMPFYDESGYRGPWDLKYEVPEMIGDMIGGVDEYFYVVPMDSVLLIMKKPEKQNIFKKFFGLFRNKKSPQKTMSDSEVLSLSRKLGADIVITGVISDFGFRRWGGGEPTIGGYKSYKASVEINQVRVLRVSDGRPLGTIRGNDEKVVRGLGLELFGRPRQMDLEFYSLDSLDFGSKRYLSTVMGQTTVEALNKVHKELRTIIAKPDSNWYSSKNFKVLSVEAGIANIDAGSADGVSAGDQFVVFASESGVRVGKINIITIWADHISRAEIIEGKDEIRPGDRIMPEL
ncbi:MAG TPA: hypothetical protein VMZ04_10825 [Anaerolineae bacterium]|nr:hypothetical protein [Anaerolineae bacterium]